MATIKHDDLIRVPELRGKLERFWRGFELVTQSQKLLNRWLLGPGKLFNARLVIGGIFVGMASLVLISIYLFVPTTYESEHSMAFVGWSAFFVVTLAATYSILRLIVSFFVINNICELAVYIFNKGLREGSQVYLCKRDAIRASQTLDMLMEVRRFTYRKELFIFAMVLQIITLAGLGVSLWFGLLLVALVVLIEQLANYGDNLAMGLIEKLDDFGRDDLLFDENFLL